MDSLKTEFVATNHTGMDSNNLRFTPLRISTLVTTGHLGTTLNLEKLFNQFYLYAIPIGYPDEGFLKIEYGEKAIGYSSRDILSKRKVSKNSFFNQSTLVVRKKKEDGSGYKEVNIKLFANGGFQMTGITSENYSKNVLQWLINIMNTMPTKLSEKEFSVQKFSVQLLNSDYKMNALVRRDELHRILVNKYKLFSTLETTIYQGINTKYYYNEKSLRKNGICWCDKPCSGQGDGKELGNCKRITIAIFQTGSVIITGARNQEQLDESYEFINKILKNHATETLKPIV
jgi:TATA-box binding protein (TBP) (component of TFIID and TFIIIB)